MNHRHHLFLAGALVWMPAFASLAQTTITPAVRDNRDGRIVLSDTQAKANDAKPDATLPKEVRDRLARFERAREAYLRNQEELRRALLGASTEKDRDRIREQIRSNLDAWRDRLRSIREEMKDRLPDLKRRLPELSEVLDNARNNARDAAVNSARKRRGQD